MPGHGGMGPGKTLAAGVLVLLAFVRPALAQPLTGGHLGLALRLRPELRTNPDLDLDEDDSLAFVGSRLRATVSLEAIQRFRLVAQIQDGRRFGTESATLADEATLDLHQGYLEAYGFADGRVDLRLGRMELALGDERLIGTANWSDVARAFDGASLRMLPWASLGVELFGAVVRERRLLRVVDATGSSTDQFTSGEGVAGAFAAWRPSLGHELDAYLLARFDGPTAVPRLPERDRRIFSPGLRAAGTFGSILRYGAEGSVQAGVSNGTCQPPCTTIPTSEKNDHFAWAVAALLQLTFPVAGAPWVGAEFDMASGDGDPNDGESREFDTFFPSNHPNYGVMDLMGWRNMRDIRLRAGAAPFAGWTFSADVHLLGLQQRHGAWTDAAGNVLDDPELDLYDADVRDLGTELDVGASWAPSPPVKMAAGWSLFVPGPAARQRRGDDVSTWAFVLVEVALDGELLHSTP